jgi:antitoxin (DNA-binding transcriptional repressor) of toxin-antitoxin stability system
MKFITVREFRTGPSAIWKDLKNELELVITNNGKPIALLTPLADDNIEETLRSIRKARAEEAVRTMRMTSSENKNNLMPIDDIDREIKKYRTGK